MSFLIDVLCCLQQVTPKGGVIPEILLEVLLQQVISEKVILNEVARFSQRSLFGSDHERNHQLQQTCISSPVPRTYCRVTAHSPGVNASCQSRIRGLSSIVRRQRDDLRKQAEIIQPHRLQAIRAGSRGWFGLMMPIHNLTATGSGTAIAELPVSSTRPGSAMVDLP